MSDTPRTDRVLKNCNGWHHVPIELARELERELNAANYEVQHLREVYIQLQEGNERQRQRIKRLEEAGDAMHWAFMHPFDTGNESVADAWHKAKEAKL